MRELASLHTKRKNITCNSFLALHDGHGPGAGRDLRRRALPIPAVVIATRGGTPGLGRALSRGTGGRLSLHGVQQPRVHLYRAHHLRSGDKHVLSNMDNVGKLGALAEFDARTTRNKSVDQLKVIQCSIYGGFFFRRNPLHPNTNSYDSCCTSTEDLLPLEDEVFQLGKLGYEIYEFCTSPREESRATRKNTYCRPLGIGR